MLRSRRRVTAGGALGGLAAGVLVTTVLIAGGGRAHPAASPRPASVRTVRTAAVRPAATQTAATQTAATHPAATHPAATQTTTTRSPVTGPPADPRQLAEALNQAERVIDNPAAPPDQLDRAALLDQLATGALLHRPAPARRAVLARLTPAAAATVTTDLAAARALTGVEPIPTHLPPWHIVEPLPAQVLLGDLQSAGARYGIGWEYLASIALIESRYGRIAGPSTAGAEGPMQFLPSTWAIYGHGDIRDPRQSILAAARLLAADGGRRDIGAALYHYNMSLGYVHAVEDYAARMRTDARAFFGYERWVVIYADRRGTMLLPTGFPRVRPVPLAALWATALT